MLRSKIYSHFDLPRTLHGHPSPTTGTCTGPKLQHHPTSNAAHRFRHTLLGGHRVLFAWIAIYIT